MTPDTSCPACRMPVHLSGLGHRTSDGPVHYARCLCGRWVVVLAGVSVAAAGSPEVPTRVPEVPTRVPEVPTRVPEVPTRAGRR